MPELLDSTKLLDKLCIKYSEKRNYLKGYLPYLEQLESEGKIEIILKKRLYARVMSLTFPLQKKPADWPAYPGSCLSAAQGVS